MASPLTMNQVAASIISLNRHANNQNEHLQHQLGTLSPSLSPQTSLFMPLYHSHSTTPTMKLPTAEDEPTLSSTPVLSSSASTTSTAHEDEDSILPHEHFYSHLQTNTSLLRIVLRRSLPVTLTANQWHPLKLEVRDEFGMTLEGQRAKTSTMHLMCELLEQRRENHAISLSTDWKVSWRPPHYDAWESMEDVSQTCAGFDGSGTGGLDFSITETNNSNGQRPASATRFYLRVLPTFVSQQTIHALPLVVGPFFVIPAPNWDETSSATMNHVPWMEQGNDIGRSSTQLVNINSYSQNMYRAFNLKSTNQYFMIKEGWDLGTPGKMWDSALMISDLFIQRITRQPGCLENCHLLDLSAGTGVTGLLIYFIYKHMFPACHRNMKITLTDLPQALPLIHYNQKLNGIAPSRDLAVSPLRWGVLEDVRRIKKKTPIDIIIASDVLYEPTQFAALMKTLVYLSEPGRTVVYLGYKRRGLNKSDEQYFLDLCCDAFDMQVVGYSNGDDDDGSKMAMNGDNENGDGNDMVIGDNTGPLNDSESGSVGGHDVTINKQSNVGWEKRYGKLVRNEACMNGEGWLGYYAKAWQANARTKANGNNSDMGFDETGVQIYRLVRKQQRQ